MDFVDTVYRYITGSNDGLLGKLRQHQDTFNLHLPDDFVPEDNVVGKELSDKLDTVPKFLARGSMAYIYKAKYHGTKIAIKVIPPNIKNHSIPKQLSTLDKLTYIKYFNPDLVGPIEDVKAGLKQETSMDNEYTNYQKMLKTNPDKYNISLVTPVDELCNDDYFVYEYIKGKPLASLLGKSQDTINDCLSRIIQWSMEATFRGILIADINVGNFLYNESTDTIYAIDYGSVVESQELTAKSREIYHKCKTDQGIEDLVNAYCGGAQDAKIQFETFRQIIHHKTITPAMGDITKDIASMLFDISSVRKVKGFDHIIDILRSQHMTLNLIAMFNVQVELPDDFCKDCFSENL